MTTPPLVKVPVLPKNLVPEECDRVFQLPAGLTETWLRLEVVRPVWFVSRGMIVRGVRVSEVRPLVNHRRVRAVERSRGLEEARPVVGSGGRGARGGGRG